MTGPATGPTQAFALAPDAWLRFMQSRAGDYYPDLFPRRPQVELVRAAARGYTIQYVIDVRTAGAVRRVVVKHTNVRAPDAARPLTTAQDVQSRKHRSEWRALQHLHERLGDGGRATAVRPLEHLPDEGVIVMEWLDSTALRDCLRPFRRVPTGLDTVMAGAGQVVRVLHELPLPTTSAPDADLYRGMIHRFATHLGTLDPRAEGTWRRLRGSANALEERLGRGPFGAHHGDLAPRNLLVTPSGCVACIDMAALECRPVAADLANLRSTLRMAMVQRGGPVGPRRDVVAIERVLLDAYLGVARADDVRTLQRSVDAHEVLVLLDRWTSLASTARRGPLGRVRVRWQTHLVRRWLTDAVDALELD